MVIAVIVLCLAADLLFLLHIIYDFDEININIKAKIPVTALSLIMEFVAFALILIKWLA